MATIGCKGISDIVFELTRQLEDRIRIQYEDEIHQLHNEIARLRSSCDNNQASMSEVPMDSVAGSSCAESTHNVEASELIKLFTSLEDKYVKLLAESIELAAAVKAGTHNDFGEHLGGSAYNSSTISVLHNDETPLQRNVSSSKVRLNPQVDLSNRNSTCKAVRQPRPLEHMLEKDDIIMESQDELPPTCQVLSDGEDTQDSISLDFPISRLTQQAPEQKKLIPENKHGASSNDRSKFGRQQALELVPKKRQRDPLLGSSSSSNRDRNNENVAANCDDDVVVVADTARPDSNPQKRRSPPSKPTSKAMSTSSVIVNSSSTGKHTESSNATSSSRGGKFAETVRSKSLREIMPGHICTECSRFYDAMVDQGMAIDG
jgi:hypothetical protein